MEHKTFSVISHYDHLKLDGVMIIPDTPKAIVQFAHGMCEHKERYIPFMEYLCQYGYLCIIHDHRGHGKSIKNKNDLGFFYNGKNKGLVEDIELVNQYVKKQYPHLPLYLFGHSMGSLAVRAYTKKYDDHINGLIVCGCPSQNTFTSIGLLLVNLLTKIKGEKYKSELINQLVLGAFDKPFKNEHTPNAWVCSDKDIVKAFNDSELCGFSFTMNGYQSLLTLVKDVYSPNHWKISNPKLPIYFISGSLDPCRINDKKFKEAVQLMKNVGYKNTSYRLFNDMRHEILNETNKEIVYEDVLKTLEEWFNHNKI